MTCPPGSCTRNADPLADYTACSRQICTTTPMVPNRALTSFEALPVVLSLGVLLSLVALSLRRFPHG